LCAAQAAPGARPAPPPSQGESRAARAPQEEIAALKKQQLDLAEALLKEFPNHDGVLVLMGNALGCQGRQNEAAEFWTRALALNPKRPDVYQSLGQSAMAREDYETAVRQWQKALELEPQRAGIRGSLGLALMGLARHREAVEELEAGRKVGTMLAFDHFVLGQAYLQLGQLEQARAAYEKAIQLQPDYSNAYYGLFTVWTRLNEADKARECMTTFQKLKAEEMKVLKDRNDAFNDLQEVRGWVAETFTAAGLLYQKQGNLPKSEQLLRRAAAIDPQNVAALNELGFFYQAQGRRAEARAAFRQAAAIKPPNPIACLNLGLLLGQENRLTEAEEAFRMAIRAAPARSEGYRELAQLYLRAGVKLPEAMQLAEKALALEPVAMNYFVLSRAYDCNGDPGRALSALKRATELEPGNVNYRQTYDRLRAREAKR
jgi:tetratricopeptide (TPR) repeat protein